MKTTLAVSVTIASLFALAASAAASGTLHVGSDNRSGTIRAFLQNFGDPVEAGYNIDPGTNEWQPINFNQSVQAHDGNSLASASLNSQSAYVGYNQAAGTFTSLSATSASNATLHIVNPPQSGNCQAQDRVSMGFSVQGLTGNQRMVVRLQGAIASGNGTSTHSVALSGSGGLNVNFTAVGAFNRVVALGNGDYTLLAQSNIQFSSSAVVNQTATTGFTLTLAPTSAGDLNCDGQVDFGDINAFVELLTNPALWQTHHPGCQMSNGDLNGDGHVNFGDINDFVALLSGI